MQYCKAKERQCLTFILAFMLLKIASRRMAFMSPLQEGGGGGKSGGGGKRCLNTSCGLLPFKVELMSSNLANNGTLYNVSTTTIIITSDKMQNPVIV